MPGTVVPGERRQPRPDGERDRHVTENLSPRTFPWKIELATAVVERLSGCPGAPPERSDASGGAGQMGHEVIDQDPRRGSPDTNEQGPGPSPESVGRS